METEKEKTNDSINYTFNDLYDIVDKNKDNLSNIDINIWKRLSSKLLIPGVDLHKQIKIMEIFLDNFFSQKLKKEYISCFANLFYNSYDIFKIKSYSEVLQDYYDKYFKKEPIDITKLTNGTVMDFLIEKEGVYYHWTRCLIINTDIEKKLVTLKVPYSNETFTVNVDSFRLYPVNTFTKDYEWRINLKEGDLIDTLDDLGYWLKGTIVERKDNMVKVGLRIYQKDNSFYGYTPEYDTWFSIYNCRIQKYETLSFDIHAWNKYPNRPVKIQNNLSDMHIPFVGNNYCIPLIHYNTLIMSSLEYIDIANYIIRKIVNIIDTQDDKWFNNPSFDYVFYFIELFSTVRSLIHRSFGKDFIIKVFNQIIKKSLINYSKGKDTNISYSLNDVELCFEHVSNLLLGCLYPFEVKNLVGTLDLEFTINLMKENTNLERRLYELNIINILLEPKGVLFFTDEQISFITKELLIENEKGKTFIELMFNSNNHIEIIKRGSSIISRLFKLKIITKREIEKLYNYIQIFKNNADIQNEIYNIFEKNAYEMDINLCKDLCTKILMIDNNLITERDASLLLSICKYMETLCKNDINRDKDLEIKILNKVYEFIFRKDHKKTEDITSLIFNFINVLSVPNGEDNEKYEYFKLFLVKAFENAYSDEDPDNFSFFISYLTLMLQCLNKNEQEIFCIIKNELITKNENGEKFKRKIINLGKQHKGNLNVTIFQNFKLIFKTLEINLTENEINELFDVFVFNCKSIPIHNCFLGWINETEKLKLCDLSLSQDHLMNNLFSYCSNKENKEFIDYDFIIYFYDYFISLIKDTIITKSKHFDTFYQILLKYGSVRILNQFITYFSLKKLPQSQRFEVWSEFAEKLFETLKKKSKNKIIKKYHLYYI